MTTRPGALARSAGLFIGAFALLNFAAARMRDDLARQRAADLLIDETLQDSGKTPRWDFSVGEALERYWPHIPDARRTRFTAVVGMSQMYSINDPREGDLTIAEHVDDILSERGMRAFGLAAPNMNNEEALFYLLALGTYPETRPYAFVYGVCFDKFRNIDMRPGLRAFARKRPETLETWKAVALRHQDCHPRAADKMRATLDEIERTGAQQESSSFESRLRERVAQWLPVVGTRKDINAVLFNSLYGLRNAVLGIKSSTKRPIIGARYDLNRDFLEVMAEEAAHLEVKFLPYVIPLNPVADTPYVKSEYAGFLEWYAGLAQRHGLRHVNFDALVPAEEWGLRLGEPDFKHFQGRAHQRTARAIVEAFDADLAGDRSALR